MKVYQLRELLEHYEILGHAHKTVSILWDVADGDLNGKHELHGDTVVLEVEIK